jgi:hypothetical protein
MPLLTKEEILQINDLAPTIERIPGPAGMGEVGVRVMTSGEREDFIKALDKREQSGEDVTRQRPWLCAMTLCDEDGGRLFSLTEIEALAGKSSEFIDRVFIVARRLNGLEPDTAEDTKKNSVPIPDAASSSTSAGPSVDGAPANGHSV